jgi:hypothetical protein
MATTTYKILGQSSPTTTSNVDLYTVPALTQSIVSTLVVTNVAAAAGTATIYIRKAGAAAGSANTLIKAASVAVADFKAITIGLTLEAADVITVVSGTANALSFQAFGSEIA